MSVPPILEGLDLARAIRSQVEAGNIELASLGDSVIGLLRDLEAYEDQYMGHAPPIVPSAIQAQAQAFEMEGAAEAADNQLLIDEFGVSDPAALRRMKELGIVEGLRESPAPPSRANRFIDPATGEWISERPSSGSRAAATAQPQAQAQTASRPVRRGSSRTTSTRRSESPASAGKTLQQYNTELDLDIRDVNRRIREATDSLYEYDAESEKPSPESKDLELMRALADQINSQPTGPYSNIAAQLAMVQDPNFAKVWDSAANRRINRARQHFGRMGQIQRMAQGEKAARAQYRSRGRKRSEEKLKILGREKDQLIRAKHKLAADQRNEDFRREMAHLSGGYRVQAGAASAARKSESLGTLLSSAYTTQDRTSNQITKIEKAQGDVKEKVLDSVRREMGLPTTTSRADTLKALRRRQRENANYISELERQRRGNVTRVLYNPARLGDTGGAGGRAPAAGEKDAASRMYE